MIIMVIYHDIYMIPQGPSEAKKSIISASDMVIYIKDVKN